MDLLIVEDSPSYAAIETRTLESHGHSVVHAASLEGARAALQEKSDFDVIILDLGLADSEDEDTARELASLYGGPIIVLTGEDVDHNTMFELGVEVVLSKMDNEHLRLEEHLGEACARAAGRRRRLAYAE